MSDPLKTLLARFYPAGQATDPPIYRYSEDFETLWESIADPEEPRIDSRPIVIVWDETPLDNDESRSAVSAQSILSPLTWATCAGRGEGAPPRVLVLDLNPPVHDQSSVYRNVRTLGDSLRSHLWLLSYPQVPKEVSDISAWITGEPTRNDDAFEVLESLLVQQLSTSVGDVDRHHVANLVGPLLLVGSDRDAAEAVSSPHRRALLTVLGVYREEEADAEQLFPDPTSVAALSELGSPVEIVLVDDQLDDGWAEFVGRMVNVRKRIPGLESFDEIGETFDGQILLSTASKPEFLLKRIEEANGADLRFRSKFGCGKADSEILLLDLRLFTTREPRDEIKFFRDAIKLAEQKFVEPENDRVFPWNPFERADLDKLEAWISRADPSNWRKSSADDPYYLEALTLLPKMLALSDPSLPIIIFSSTTQSKLISRFNGYGNIITGFQKPTFFGYQDDDQRERTFQSFGRALQRAATLLRARARCRRFQSSENPYRGVGLEIDPEQHYYLEFYIDETDPQQYLERTRDLSYEKGWRVGGCFALYAGASVDQAIAKADLFEDILVGEGVRYFESIREPSPPSVIQKKNTKCVNELRRALARASREQSAPEFLGAASLYKRAPEVKNEDDLLDPAHNDQLFLITLAQLVEAFLFESVPALMGDVSPSISLVAGTRVNADRTVLEACQDQFRAGLSWQSPGANTILQHSFREDDFTPIVRGVVNGRDPVRLRRALAMQIPYAQKRQRPKRLECPSCDVTVSSSTKWLPREQLEPQPGREYRGVVVKKDESGAPVVDFGAPRWGTLLRSNGVVDSNYEVDARLDRIGPSPSGGRYYDLTWLRTVGPAKLQCPVCDSTDNWRPENRALHALADQVLTDLFGNGGRSFSRLIPPVAGEFEESTIDGFQGVLEASRALDASKNDIAKAVMIYPLDSNAREGVTRREGDVPTRPAIRDFVRWRIGQFLKTIDGKEFMRIVDWRS